MIQQKIYHNKFNTELLHKKCLKKLKTTFVSSEITCTTQV